ncbi:hypothetical protein F4810DRAFT_14538 [Camillea tinctor]|nr:hypothetical protein F4810DRAFT_14538 [Camillea tinctor]
MQFGSRIVEGLPHWCLVFLFFVFLHVFFHVLRPRTRSTIDIVCLVSKHARTPLWGYWRNVVRITEKENGNMFPTRPSAAVGFRYCGAGLASVLWMILFHTLGSLWGMSSQVARSAELPVSIPLTSSRQERERERESV